MAGLGVSGSLYGYAFWSYFGGMVNMQIKDVPVEIRDQLADTARTEGKSLQNYLLGVLTEQAEFTRNTALLAGLPLAGSTATPADVVAAVRASRDGGTPTFDAPA